MCERNYISLTIDHLTISDSIYLECLKIFLISEALRSFGYGSGIPCILQEDALKTEKRALMKPNGRRRSASDWGNPISAACTGFGGHVSVSE